MTILVSDLRKNSSLFSLIVALLFLFYVKNQIVFQTNITEIDTLEKNYWYCKCKLLIASLHSLFKASSPKLFATLLSEFTIKIEFYY